jgi:hypothetical protein
MSSVQGSWNVTTTGYGADGGLQMRLESGHLISLHGINRVNFVDGYLDLSGTSNAAQVQRLYETLLSRQATVDEVSFWAEKIDTGTSLASIAGNFFNSTEFQTYFGNMTDIQLIKGLYHTALGREAEQTGLIWHLDNLRSGLSKSELVVNFITSQEAVDRFVKLDANGIFYQNKDVVAVSMAYKGIFGRESDRAGQDFWTAKLTSGETSVDSMVRSFMDSPEFKSKFGNLEISVYIDKIYQNVLGREADEAGKEFWYRNILLENTNISECTINIVFSKENFGKFKMR